MEPCIEATAIGRDGYGVKNVKGKSVRAHRWAYEQAFGPIPKDLHICHHCDNPSCINPNHLYAGTRKQNMADKIKRNRIPKHYKLTDQDVNDILSSKDTAKVLGKKYGVSYATIYRTRQAKN